MMSKRVPTKIFPKVTTMPRQRTEAAHYLDMYKLTVEKKRIQQELEHLEERQKRLRDRLAEIDLQTEGLDAQAANLRQAIPPAPGARPQQGISFAPSANVYLPERNSRQAPEDYSMLTLDY
jgi:hypothetical protein